MWFEYLTESGEREHTARKLRSEMLYRKLGRADTPHVQERAPQQS
jgi:hypothetical protein